MTRLKKRFLWVVLLALVISIIPFNVTEAASLSVKKTSVAVGSKITITLSNNNSNVKWSMSNGHIKIVKKNNSKAIIKGVSKGKSVLTAKIGSKKLKCKVTITQKENLKYDITDKYVFYERSEYSNEGSYRGYVEITNTGNVPLYLGDATFDLEDESGHLVKTETSVNTAPDIIYPGEKGYYYNQFGDSIDMTESEFKKLTFVPHVKVVKATNSLPKDYKVYDVTLGTDATFNVPEIVGRLKNDTKEDIDYIYLTALFYDDSGRIIGISGSNMTDIPAGEEHSFSISSLYSGIQEGKKIANYKVIARGTYYQF